jgi:thiol-disulfide isomerase/thioredoxin
MRYKTMDVTSRSRRLERARQALARLTVLGVLTLASRPATSQLLTPNIAITGARTPGIVITPSMALTNTQFETNRSSTQVVWATKLHYPKDSLDRLKVARATQWVTSFPVATVRGIHLDDYATIAADAHNDALAQEEITTRLKAPGLSINDKAYTLKNAVAAFAHEETPERLPIAERYLAQLDALGPAAAYQQFVARDRLVYVYYRLGRSTDVARVGLQALELVPRMRYDLREVLYGPLASAFLYGAAVDAVSGQPNGHTTLRALNTKLRAAAEPPAEYRVESDSFFIRQAKFGWIPEIERKISIAERVGAQAPPLIANYWVNRGATRDSQSVAVNDRKIRVVEIGSFTCPGCMAAVPGLERLYQRYRGVEFTFMTSTQGWWGNRIIDAKDEADSLAKHFVNVARATFPIGIAMQRRVATDDGGSRTVESTPTWHADQYPQISKPTFYVLDGRGIVRRILTGYGRDLEENIANIVEFLQKESNAATHPPSMSGNSAS